MAAQDLEIKIKGKNMREVGEKIASATGTKEGVADTDLEFLIRSFDDNHFLRVYKFTQGRNRLMKGKLVPSQFTMEDALTDYGPGNFRFQVVNSVGKIQLTKDFWLGDVDDESGATAVESSPVRVSDNNDVLAVMMTQSQNMIQIMVQQQQNQATMFAQIMASMVALVTGMNKGGKSDIDHLEQLSNVQRNLLESVKPSGLLDDIEKLDKLRSFLGGGGDSSWVKEALELGKGLIAGNQGSTFTSPATNGSMYRITSADIPPSPILPPSSVLSGSQAAARIPDFPLRDPLRDTQGYAQSDAPITAAPNPINFKPAIDAIFKNIQDGMTAKDFVPYLSDLDDRWFSSLYHYLFVERDFNALKLIYPFLGSDDKFKNCYAELKTIMESEFEAEPPNNLPVS